MMKKVLIEIESCKDCPHFKITGTSSTDGFDRGDEWYCTKEEKMIDGFVEWHENPPIPLWCPFREKQINQK